MTTYPQESETMTTETPTMTTTIKPKMMTDAATRWAWEAGNNSGKGYAAGVDLLESLGVERTVAERWQGQAGLDPKELAHWPASDHELIWNGLSDDDGVVHVVGWSHGPWCVDVAVDDDGNARPV